MRRHHRLGRQMGRELERAPLAEVAPPEDFGSWSFGEVAPPEDFGSLSEVAPAEDFGFLAGIDANSAAISALAGVGVAAVTGKPLYGLLAGLGTYFGAQYLLK